VLRGVTGMPLEIRILGVDYFANKLTEGMAFEFRLYDKTYWSLIK
jgi:hypothetical protein